MGGNALAARTPAENFIAFQPVGAAAAPPPSAPAAARFPQPKGASEVKIKLEIETAGTFTCPHLPHLYDAIKELPGARFTHQMDAAREEKRKRKDSYWSIPLAQYQALLQRIPPAEAPAPANLIPEGVLQLFTSASEIARRRSTTGFDLGCIEEAIRTQLFPFQREGIQMALARGGRVILADDMGLGKSIQALGVASYYRREWPLLIISPASMVSSWHEQVQRWLPSVARDQIAVMYDGKTALDRLVNIGSFDLLARHGEAVAARGFRVVIVDESHALKNSDSKRSKALIPVIAQASRALLLSGTPALSRPVELFSQIKAVSPKLFPNYFDFGRRYCAGHKTPWGWDMKGASNTAELQLVLENTIMIRRVKSEVLTQLPPKIRQQVFLKISPKDLKVFAGAGSPQLASLDDLGGLEARNELMDLWRKTGEAKAPAMLEYIEDLLEADHKVLVFAHHKSILDHFEDAFLRARRKHIRIDGTTAPALRQDICTRFQADPLTRVALLSVTAANTGLTLTAATTVVFAELYWNPGQMVQAEDRAHRIGQCDSVSVHYLLARGTTDDTLWPLLLKKLSTLEAVGLGKNDFKGMHNREHDSGQLTLDRCWKRPRLDLVPADGSNGDGDDSGHGHGNGHGNGNENGNGNDVIVLD